MCIVGSKTTSIDIPTFGGTIIRSKQASEILDTDGFFSFYISDSGLLSLNTTVNTTADYGIWACDEREHTGV